MTSRNAHLIEIRTTGLVDIQGNGPRLERIQVIAGEILEGEVRCYVLDTQVNLFLPSRRLESDYYDFEFPWNDIVEVADIYLADGSGIIRGIPCWTFQFLDKND